MLNREIAGLFVLMCAILQTLVVPSVFAQTEEITPTAAAMDAGDVERFLDRVIAGQLEADGIAGATVAVVADGRVVAAKGYGMSNVDTGGNTFLLSDGPMSYTKAP